MNDLVRFANSVEYTNGKKRGRPPKFNANQFYPFKEERRLQGALKKELATFIREAYEVAIVGETFTADSLEDLSEMPERLSEGFKQEVNYAANSIAKNAYDNIANMTEMVVGKPYYPPAAKDELLKNWEANFNLLCKSAESDAKKDISRIVAQAENEGWGMKQLERAVMVELPSKYASRAKLIARTESAKLNSEVTLESFRETGCEYYTWMAAMDERTRTEHAMMHGLICSVNDPTVWYEENPEDPLHPIQHQRDDTMVHLHPGEDYQCRCTMVMWDPEIDGKYEIKERPEEPEEKEPTPLEQAREETSKAEARAEKAEKQVKETKAELNEEKRRREILQLSNERHSRRTQEYIQEILYERSNRIEERAGLIPKYVVDEKIEKSKDAKELFSYFQKKHSIKLQKALTNCNFEKLKGALSGIDSVLEIFKNAKISDVKSSNAMGYIMSANWNMNKPFFLRFSSYYMNNTYKFADTSFHPKGMSAKASAIHEMGHIVNYWIAQKESNISNYESIAREIVIKAAFAAGYKNFSSIDLMAIRKTISDYADMTYKYTETIAESFADVFVNRSRAQNMSKQVYKIVTERAKPLGI